MARRDSLIGFQGEAVCETMLGEYGWVPGGVTITAVRLGDHVVDSAGVITPHVPDMKLRSQTFVRPGEMVVKIQSSLS